VVFAVGAFGAWLVEQVADAGRKKLTELIFGDEQDRALRQAAAAAIWATVYEFSLPDSESAGQAAMVIDQVFTDPQPDIIRAGPVMLLEGLQAGVTRQLAVLDDVAVTGTGYSSADILGMPGAVLADRLTGHLVCEIIVRGSGGAALTPLADQLNHELTRLYLGQRIELGAQRVESMLAELAAQVRGAQVLPGGGSAPVGRPLAEVTDPFALEVHRSVRPEDPQSGLPDLPVYVPREHDAALEMVVRAAAGGDSGIAVLVGGSSTGKTRACWEVLQLLRDRPERWRMWHPIDPTRPDAALRELPGIGPRTVVWLNEAQFHLDVADGGLGERVAAGLRELLRDPDKAPVLVLATLWPQFWDVLTARPAASPDSHAQARELLAGHDITVPAAFTAAQLDQLSWAGDARLALAATQARDGQVIQFLAGAPELLARYRNAPPAAAALINAAVDARRLGMRLGLPREFLAAAAPGYLTDAEWDALGQSWENMLQEAWNYAAVPCKGVPGPLTPIPLARTAMPYPARPGSPDADGQRPAGQAGNTGGPLYRLADYLDQHGRAHRKEQIPPAGFWAATSAYASPVDQAALGDAADARGLYRIAAQLHKNAAASGKPRAAQYFGHPPACLRGDARPASWAAAHLPLDDPGAVLALFEGLTEAGALEQATALLHRDAASDGAFDDSSHEIVSEAFSRLLAHLRAAGWPEQAIALLRSDPAAHVPLDDPDIVAALLNALQEAGAQEQVAALLRRDPAAHVPIHDPYGVAAVLDSLWKADAHEQVAVLLRRDPAACVPLDDPDALAGLLLSLHETGAQEQLTVLLRRDPAGRVPLDDPDALAGLLLSLHETGAQEQLTVLLRRDPAACVSLDNPYGVAVLLHSLREAGLHEHAAALASRAAAHAPLDDAYLVASLLHGLLEAGAYEQAAALASRAPAHVPLDNLAGMTFLLQMLREAGAHEQITALLDRDLVACVPLSDCYGVARLLRELREADAPEHIAALLDRDPAACVHLDDRSDVAELLNELRKAGAEQQANALIARLPAAGLFRIFLEQHSYADQFRFGREADGSPSAPWGWEDLDLRLDLPPCQAERPSAAATKVSVWDRLPPTGSYRTRAD
jgi:hypothetical protein